MRIVSARFVYDLTTEDIVAYHLHHARTEGVIDGVLRKGSIAAGAVSGALVGVFIAGATESWIAALAVGCLIGVVTALAYPSVMRNMMEKSAERYIRRMHSRETAPGLLGRHELEFHPDVFTEKTSVNESKYTWDAIDRVTASDAHVFIFIGPLLAFVVPYAAGSAERAQLMSAIANGADVSKWSSSSASSSSSA